MRHHSPGLTLAGIAALFLVACGGGGGGSSGGGSVNTAPTANAGANQTANSGVTVTLNGGASSDANGTIASYAWTQTGGTPAVTLASATTVTPSFTAPTVATATAFTFSLVVTDNLGAASAAATTVVTVNPAVAGNTNVTGRVTFGRVQFLSGTGSVGLNYALPVQQPAREVKVEALAAGTTTVLATGNSNSLGDYTLSVATNTSIAIRVTAQMQRTGTPQWNVRVQDGATGNNPYSYTDPATFNSSAGGAHNVAIPTGIDATGTATGTRASGPFAVLDTIYQGMQTIVAVAPSTNFPTLIVNWGPQADGTYFQGGSNQHIALLADLTEDTDEFDQHVIAHEFGHYIEHNFSRADNIGGAHAVGEKLDPRVAFGEGFGYAFAAIVLGDPMARDSFTDDAPFTRCGVAHCSGWFDLEFNPPANPAGASNGNYGCWCSESSVWSILWDIHDTAADANDTLALGFLPIWNVLIGPQDTTPAFTTIFSFITAFKAQNVGNVAAINTLVAAQNIDAGNIDAYGSTETHVPTSVPNNAALPIYTVASVGGAAVVMRTVVESSDPLDRHNKLGNRRFVRFSLATTRDITITASSSNPNNPDTDFRVFRNGVFEGSATAGPAPNESMQFLDALPGEYLIDVFDCANGCDGPEGTPGDYNLTVTVN
jgi:hypothetical protein